MKILGFTGGSHSCGLSYVENGKPIFSFEEERFNRIRTYKDFYNNFYFLFLTVLLCFDFNFFFMFPISGIIFSTIR